MWQVDRYASFLLPQSLPRHSIWTAEWGNILIQAYPENLQKKIITSISAEDQLSGVEKRPEPAVRSILHHRRWRSYSPTNEYVMAEARNSTNTTCEGMRDYRQSDADWCRFQGRKKRKAKKKPSVEREKMKDGDTVQSEQFTWVSLEGCPDCHGRINEENKLSAYLLKRKKNEKWETFQHNLLKAGNSWKILEGNRLAELFPVDRSST